jgi:hypothetical protein
MIGDNNWTPHAHLDWAATRANPAPGCWSCLEAVSIDEEDTAPDDDDITF